MKMARIQQGNGLQSSESKHFRGTTESLAKYDDNSSDSAINGTDNTEVQTDKYGFIEGAQQYSSNS